MTTYCENALALIGNTPLVALDRIHPGPGRILAKAEFLNPGGSVKDRPALAILRRAKSRGDLRPGQTVVEMTSGNMGSALGVVCGLLGHPLVLTMSAGNSLERARMMRGLGAEVVLEPQVDGIPGQVTGNDIQAAVERARAIAIERDGYYVDQFANPGCVEAHEATTGPEIWRALDGRLDAFVAAVGSGGTFIGTARYLRSRMASVYCAAIEPAGAEVLAGEPLRKPRHLLQGTGYGRIPPQWDASLADGYLSVDDTEAVEWRQRLGEAEGLYVGYSAAANVCAAAKLLSSGRLAPEARVVTVLCDTGLKYGVPAQG